MNELKNKENIIHPMKKTIDRLANDKLNNTKILNKTVFYSDTPINNSQEATISKIDAKKLLMELLVDIDNPNIDNVYIYQHKLGEFTVSLKVER